MANGSKAIQQRQDDEVMARGAAALPGHAMQRMGTAYQMAVSVQVPRQMQRLKGNCMAEAREMKEDFFYHWKVNDKNTEDGKKDIFGASIDGAMVMLRNWGNAVVDVELVEATFDHYVFKATLIDLESGFTCPRLYRKHRSDPPGRYEKQRWDDMEFSDGQSRAIRNAICSALPPWLEKQCVREAFLAAEKGIDPKHEREDVMRRAQDIGVSAERIEKKMGKPVAKLEASELVSLRAMLRTVEEKHAKAEELFPVPQAPEQKSDGQEKDGKQAAPQMEPPKAGEALVTKFAKRIRAAWSADDLGEIEVAIKKAIDEQKLSADEVKELREVYATQRRTFQESRSRGSSPQHGNGPDSDDGTNPMHGIGHGRGDDEKDGQE